MRYSNYKNEFNEQGYALIPYLYSDEEITQISACLENAKIYGDGLVSTKDLFAIRQLINNIPELTSLLFNKNLIDLLNELFESKYFLTKAIYFDKPSYSNWFVAYHQDLSISVDKKVEIEGYSNWTFKKGQYGVQPPIEILEDTVTIRIHLDSTDKNNGALKVIPKSHLKRIIRSDSKDWSVENDVVCNVERGGVMLMRPLTLHASSRTSNGKRRRVIHLEFNRHLLSEPLQWLEFYSVDRTSNIT